MISPDWKSVALKLGSSRRLDGNNDRARVEFWSSTECVGFLGALKSNLNEKGWCVQHRFGVSQSDYWGARSTLARWSLRGRAYGVYPLSLAWRFRRAPRGLVGVVCTNTFYAPWCALVSVPRNVPVVNWVFDLFPDVLLAADLVRKGGLVERTVHRLVRFTFDRAAANIFLGEHLRRHAEREFGLIPRSHVIPIGADGSLFRDKVPVVRSHGGPVRVLYCGNLGRMHDLEAILAVIRRGLPDKVVLELRGNGVGFRTIGDALADTPREQVVLGGNLPASDWVRTMQNADVALVTIKSGAEGAIMPSKTYSALVAGQAILAVSPKRSDLADLIQTHRCGWLVEPGDLVGLNRTLQRIVDQPNELLEKRQRAFEAGHRCYDARLIAEKWSSLLKQITTQVT